MGGPSCQAGDRAGGVVEFPAADVAHVGVFGVVGGHPGAFGPNDPGARRLADNLLAAATADQLARTLVTIMDRLRNTDHPPNWEQLHTDLADWLNPATRNQVRLAWGQGFATPAATPKEAVTTD